MIDWIAGAYTSLTAAKDITKALLDIKEATAVSSKALELNGVILDVQDKLFNARTEREEMQTHIRELEAKLAEAENWELTKSQYHLVSVSSGGYVYIEKGQTPNDKAPPPYYCTTCFSKKQLSLLQALGSGGMGVRHYLCASCNTKVIERTHFEPQMPLTSREHNPYRNF